MRWSALALLASAVGFAASSATPLGAAPGRPGRIVRVERGSEPRRRPPQFYSLQSGSHLATYGRRPEPGSEVTLVDASGLRGTAVVTDVQPRASGCQTGLWDVRYDPRWDGAPPPGPYTTVGVQGLALDERARTLDNRRVQAPSEHAHETVWVGLDRDGDDVADAVVTAYPCDDGPHASPPPGADAATCVDVHLRETSHADWRRIAHDVFHACR